MDFRLNETQEMFKKVAADFVKAEVPSHKMTVWYRDKDTFRPDIYKKAAELGWLGMMIPEELAVQAFRSPTARWFSKSSGAARCRDRFSLVACSGLRLSLKAVRKRRKNPCCLTSAAARTSPSPRSRTREHTSDLKRLKPNSPSQAMILFSKAAKNLSSMPSQRQVISAPRAQRTARSRWFWRTGTVSVFRCPVFTPGSRFP